MWRRTARFAAVRTYTEFSASKRQARSRPTTRYRYPCPCSWRERSSMVIRPAGGVRPAGLRHAYRPRPKRSRPGISSSSAFHTVRTATAFVGRHRTNRKRSSSVQAHQFTAADRIAVSAVATPPFANAKSLQNGPRPPPSAGVSKFPRLAAVFGLAWLDQMIATAAARSTRTVPGSQSSVTATTTGGTTADGRNGIRVRTRSTSAAASAHHLRRLSTDTRKHEADWERIAVPAMARPAAPAE